jgi:3-isopropylmalate/(R)-2-methylmalate dehydratase small subunit
MEPIDHIHGRAISLPDADIDTDVIFPARFLLLTQKRGLGRYAFYDRRGDPGFPLNRSDSVRAPILIAGPNFGCGSSREQAPWALSDLGVKAIIAPSFGEIFATNCFKNGILVIKAADAAIERFHAEARAGARFYINLSDRTILTPALSAIVFCISDHHREALLKGWDEIARIQQMFGAAIEQFEIRQKAAAPWLWLDAASKT